MARREKNPQGTLKTNYEPALDPEAREQQLINLAVNLAEKQLLDGTASAQVITHYLKLGSTKEKLERQILETQKKLMEAKTENLQAQKHNEELAAAAIEAMRSYRGDAGDGSDGK